MPSCRDTFYTDCGIRELYVRDTFHVGLFIASDCNDQERNFQVSGCGATYYFFVVYRTFRMDNRRSCGE